MQHNVRDNKGRFTSKKKKTKAKETKLTNYIAFVLDKSGSMSGISQEAIRQYSRQIETIREESRRTGIRTFVSLYTFDNVVGCNYRNVDINNVPPLDVFNTGGMTALLDGVCVAAREINVGVSPSVSYLVVTISDGGENCSRQYTRETFKKEISAFTTTDKWSFAFLCPDYDVPNILKLGIPRGNIQAWEATERGTQAMGQLNVNATRSYYAARASGLTSTQSYFTPDLSNVTSTKMQKQLDDQSKDFLRLTVDSAARIDDFVHKTTGSGYVNGSGLYKLTKQENVQDYKKIVIQNKLTNKLYSGISDVRRMLGLPEKGTIKLRPASHPEYIIYVQSTAPNRKLVANTTLLLDKSMI